MERRSEADAVAELVTLNQTPIIDPFKSTELTDAVPTIVWPRNQKVESLERFLLLPRRRRAHATLNDAASFIAYVNTFKAKGTMLFCQISKDGGAFSAFLDYHDSDGADWCEHKADLDLCHTPEWDRWVANNARPMNQDTFANFLEDNRLDIIDPKGAEIIEVVTSIEATITGQFKSVTRLTNGDRELSYQSTTNAGAKGSLVLPEKLTLQLPVFMGGPMYTVEAWFRYRIKEGTLTLFYELIRPHKVVEQAMKDMRDAIAAGTGLVILTGDTAPLPIPA